MAKQKVTLGNTLILPGAKTNYINVKTGKPVTPAQAQKPRVFDPKLGVPTTKHGNKEA